MNGNETWHTIIALHPNWWDPLWSIPWNEINAFTLLSYVYWQQWFHFWVKFRFLLLAMASYWICRMMTTTNTTTTTTTTTTITIVDHISRARLFPTFSFILFFIYDFSLFSSLFSFVGYTCSLILSILTKSVVTIPKVWWDNMNDLWYANVLMYKNGKL